MSNTGDDILNACKHLWKAGGHMARAGGSILNAIFDDSNCSCPYCGKRYNLKDGYYKCSCEKCFRKTGDKTLTDDETVNDVIADIIKILAILSKADGRVTHAEIEIIKEFLREHDLNKNQFIWCVDLFNDFRHNAYSSLYIDKIKKFCDSVAIEYFLKLLSKLAEVDGGISKEQYYLIHQILNDLSISIDFYNQVTNVKLNENNKYSSKKSKNTIRCPKCNTEYNLTDGYYNCECSEEIRVLNGEVCEKGKYVNQIIDAAVCLAAYISKADGQVTDNEIAVLRRFLQELKLNGDEIKYCAIRFNQCKSEQFNNEIIYDLVDSYEPKGYEIPLFLMISMALADGEISKGQDCIISEFMRITKLPLSLYEAMKHELEGDSELNLDESYKILGISKEASPEEIKKAYKHLLKIYHPDMQSSKGLHEEIMKDLRKKFDEIQAAYDNIKKVKNFQ